MRLSPDGRRLAFASARAGGKRMQIWIAEADGSNRSNSPMVLESVRARRPGRPTGGGLPLTRRGKDSLSTCG